MLLLLWTIVAVAVVAVVIAYSITKTNVCYLLLLAVRSTALAVACL